jgi:hypothetical protein
MNIEQMAAKIYSEAYGSIDSKGHRADKQGEIEDWLADGDLDGDETVGELIEMWGDHIANVSEGRA